MEDPSIRRATLDDAEALAAVYRSAYRDNRRRGFPAGAESATAGDVADWIRNYGVYVAESDAAVVGGVRLDTSDPDRAKVSRLGVREDRKGEGIGSRLLARAETAARERGCEIVWLTTPGEHPRLPEFYRARGYEEAGDYPLENREYDEIIMEKRFG